MLIDCDTAPPMTSAERRQYEGWERRRSAWIEAVRLHGEGRSIKAIARELGLARNTVRSDSCRLITASKLRRNASTSSLPVSRNPPLK